MKINEDDLIDFDREKTSDNIYLASQIDWFTVYAVVSLYREKGNVGPILMDFNGGLFQEWLQESRKDSESILKKEA